MVRSFEDFAALRAEIALSRQRELLDYWLRIRGARRMPGRQDVRPEDMAWPLLPHIGLLDVLAGSRFRYRLIGTAMVRFYGRDYTGTVIEETKATGYASVLNRLYRLCADDRSAVYSETRSRYRHGVARRMNRLMLPLSRSGLEVDMILFSTMPGPIVDGRGQHALHRLDGDEILAIDPDFEPFVAAA